MCDYDVHMTLADQGLLDLGAAARIPHDRAAAGCGADDRDAARGARLGHHLGRFSRQARRRDRRGRVRLFARRLRPVVDPRRCRARSTTCSARRARCCRALLDAIGFRRGILLGHSDGASIAAWYAGSVQDHRVRGLVLMAPHFFMEAEPSRRSARSRKTYETTDLRARLARHHADVDAAFRGWSGAWLDPGFATFDITEALAYIRVPVLVVQGAADRYGTLAQVASRGGMLLPGRDAVLPDVGHAPHREKPEETLAAVARVRRPDFREGIEARDFAPRMCRRMHCTSCTIEL